MRAANLRVFTTELDLLFPGVVIYGVGDDAHKLRVSDHNADDTIGSLAAQSDLDTVPEHRAIDVMLGPSFSRQQAHALIQWILSQPKLLRRLKYINFENMQWSRSTGWVGHDNSDDPHPDHVHFSGWAADDENTESWLSDMSVWDERLPKPPEMPGNWTDATAREYLTYADMFAKQAAEKLVQVQQVLDNIVIIGKKTNEALAALQAKVDALELSVDIRPILREELDNTRLSKLP